MFGRLRSSSKVVTASSRRVWNTVKAEIQERKEHIPPFALFVGISALCFQIAVLYPWHHELSDQFIEVKRVTLDLLETSAKLDKKVEQLLQLEQEIKAKEKKILEREDVILEKGVVMDEKLNKLLETTQIQTSSEKF